MVWLKIREHDIVLDTNKEYKDVVVWLKIREHDIGLKIAMPIYYVVVWLKIREHDITFVEYKIKLLLWFD